MPLRIKPLSLNNACSISTVLTLQPHLDPTQVVQAFTKHGFTEKHGTPGYAVINAMLELGITFEPVSGFPIAKTVRDFCRRYPVGAYYVVVPGHALAVINGVPLDPYYGRVKARSVVTHAKRILSNVDMVCDQRPSLHTASYERFYAMMCSPFNTVGEILSSCSYTLADLQWDLKAGYISLQRG